MLNFQNKKGPNGFIPHWDPFLSERYTKRLIVIRSQEVILTCR